MPDPTAVADATHDVHFTALEDAPRLMEHYGLRPGACVVITDDHVAPLYAERLSSALTRQQWSFHTIVVPHGEASKSQARLAELYDEVLARGIDRQTPVLALGGGVVGDLAGFAAATLLRGLPLIQIPTTLIAQVDSSIGGKTGINHTVGKNLIGAFHQPTFILSDVNLLRSLPDREWLGGLSEVVKHALIADEAFADWLIANWPRVIDRDSAVLESLVRRAAEIKVRIVKDDLHERGRRALLNFGHTFGHALERTAGYGAVTHGEAVAAGMRAATFLSKALYPDAEFQRADDLLRLLPPADGLAELSTARLMEAMRFDKKMDAGRLRLIVLRKVGEAEVVEGIEPPLIEAAWRHAKSA